MENSINERTIRLLGEDTFSKITSAHILIVGLGGVGGTAFECLLRSGFRNFILIDGDKVSLSNLNRQILYTLKDVGKLKIQVATDYAKSINNLVQIESVSSFINEENIDEILSRYQIDYIVDAIDMIDSKVSLVKYALSHNILLISSLGMGNRLCPERTKVITLNKTFNDPLAKKYRKLLKDEQIDISHIKVVFSEENPLQKGSVISSMMMVPSSAGLLIAYDVINTLINKNNGNLGAKLSEKELDF